ncbi:SRPBCC family protein [Actinophytocola sp.]|uniref:SRPBCC family protein n=1 Tax=Actinophytocola sp. TaxID=1872138 RepID=UPI003899E62E
MRATSISVRIRTGDVPGALAAIADFGAYPALAGDVRAVVPAAGGSQWTVNFRRGLMRWHETEVVEPAAARITFEQTSGDFAEFAGSWQLTPVVGGARVDFAVSWDFGIESMAGIMDPIAERVIKRVVCDVLSGLFGEITVLAGGEALTDLGRAA